MAHSTTKFNLIKPLKGSQKVRLRKELEKQKKLGIVKEEVPKLEKCGWALIKLIIGDKTRSTEYGWEFKLL